MMVIVCRVVCDVHIVSIVAVWIFLHVTSKRRTTLLFYCCCKCTRTTVVNLSAIEY